MTEQKLWSIEVSETAKKQLSKLDKPVQLHIQKLINRLEKMENPKTKGKPLQGNLREFWRFRVGDYRIIANIFEDRLIIQIVQVGHRKEIYH